MVVTVGGDAQEENPTKASLKSLDLVLCGLSRGRSWDRTPIICCLWLLFLYPDWDGKVAFPPACLPSLAHEVGRSLGSALQQGWAPSP